MLVVDVLVFGKDIVGDWLSGQITSAPAQQAGPREVGLPNQPLLADSEITHGCPIVEVEIAGPRGFEFILGPAQFLVLHLQLDLMHLQFVDSRPASSGDSVFGG